MTTQPGRNYLLYLPLVMLVLAAATGFACAEAAVRTTSAALPPAPGWSSNVPVIPEGQPDGHMPRVVVDRQGRVHMFWVAKADAGANPEDAAEPAVLMYRRLTGNEWTEPRDVLATVPIGPFIIGPVAIDDRDVLNVLWFDQGSSRRLFLSQAHVAHADSAPEWTTTTLESPRLAMGQPGMALGDGGVMHVVYPLDHSSIVYISSSNYGASWSDPQVIWNVGDPATEAVEDPRIAVDGRGNLHVTWTRHAQSRDWGPVAVYHARSTDGGQSWSPRLVQGAGENEPTAGGIGVAVRNGSEIHLVWNRAIGTQKGRYHAWSADYGQTWTDPKPFLPDFISGQTTTPIMVEDAAGTLHLATAAGGANEETMPRYTTWDGTEWTPMVSFPETTADEDLALAVGLGNQLHLVHANKRFEGRLLYNSRLTGAPATAAEQIPEPTVAPAAAAAAPTTTTRAEEAATVQPAPSPVLAGASGAAPGGLASSPVAGVVVPFAAVLLLLVPFVFLQVWRLRRR